MCSFSVDFYQSCATATTFNAIKARSVWTSTSAAQQNHVQRSVCTGGKHIDVDRPVLMEAYNLWLMKSQQFLLFFRSARHREMRCLKVTDANLARNMGFCFVRSGVCVRCDCVLLVCLQCKHPHSTFAEHSIRLRASACANVYMRGVLFSAWNVWARICWCLSRVVRNRSRSRMFTRGMKYEYTSKKIIWEQYARFGFFGWTSCGPTDTDGRTRE